VIPGRKRRAAGLSLVALVVIVGATALGTGGASAGSQSPFALPRTQTLYTSGKQWAPYTSFNVLAPDYVTGAIGLLYETPFRYDPLADKFVPWLATSGKWVGKNYVLTVRKGVAWNDGKPLTAADVKFTFQTQKLPGSQYGTMWRTGLKSITTKGNVVTFHFAGKPDYQEWDWDLYQIPIVPQHVWSGYSAKDIVSGNLAPPNKEVGTGPFMYSSGAGGSQTLVWTRRSGWWATKAFGLKMPMKYIVDIHNTSNTASLQNFLQDKIDLSNNFFPGIDKYIGKGGVFTYYAKAPYMLPANTAWLIPNTTKAPLSDAKFRRALAMSINVNQIVAADYGHIVSAANPTGLLPTWNKWIDKPQATKLGFSYSIPKAKALLAASGYKDTNGDGYVENKDGSKINLQLIVPNGWSDWMTAIQIIAASAKNAGIRITPAYPDYNALVDQRNGGSYDLVINNDKQIGNSPWAYYDYLFRLPVTSQQTVANFSRFTQAGAAPWALTVKLDQTPSSNVKRLKALNSQIQKYILTYLPAIPLWYNGMWAQYNTSVWTNFPTSAGKGLQNTPSTWNGYLNMTGINALANLKPAK
jgi:peptide/nickel transport system substrate-binding protein